MSVILQPFTKDFRTFTDAEFALIPAFIDKWMTIGLSTEAVDRDRAADGLKMLFNFCDMPLPRLKWYDSPQALSEELTHMMFCFGDISDTSEYKQTNTAADLLESQIHDLYFKDSFSGNASFASICHQNSAYLHSLLESEGAKQATAFSNLSALAKARRSALSTALATQHNLWTKQNRLPKAQLGWLCRFISSHFDENRSLPFYSRYLGKFSIRYGKYYPEHFGIALIDWYLETTGSQNKHPLLDALRLIVANVDTFMPWNHFVFLSDRPTNLCLDEDGQLHDYSRPAIQYIDDFSVDFWHGQLITKEGSILLQQPEFITEESIANCADDPTRSLLEQHFQPKAERKLTLLDIFSEREAWKQSNLVNQYGQERFAQECDRRRLIRFISKGPHIELDRTLLDHYGLINFMLDADALDIIVRLNGTQRQTALREYGTARFVRDADKQRLLRYILVEPNVELRRTLIQHYGWKQFMLDANAKCIHEDELGILYRLELKGDHPLMMVRVVNATAEKDGTYKDYYLQIDPQVRPMWQDGTTGQISFGKPQTPTARNAIASTWGLRGEEYYPEVET